MKWANRMNRSSSSSTHDLALEGYLLLAERTRSPLDKLFIKTTIEKITNTKINEHEQYQEYFSRYLK